MVPYAADPYLDLESDVTEIVSGTYQGKFYGIPIWGGVCLMWYNVPMFAENALPRPVDLVKANNWTWDTFLEVGRKLTADFNGDGQMDRFAIPQVSASWAPAWAPFVWQAGGDMIGEDGYTILVDSPETIAGLQFCVDLMWEYRVNTGGDRVEPEGWERVFFDDFRAFRISPSTSNEGDLWQAPGWNTAVGNDARLLPPGATPDVYPHDPENQLQTISIAKQGNTWYGSAFYSVNDLGQGYVWSGPKIFRIRCMFPKIAEHLLPGGLFPAFWSYGIEFLYWRTSNRIEVDWFEFVGTNGYYYNGMSSHLHYTHVKNIFVRQNDSYQRYKVFGGNLTPLENNLGLYVWDGQFHTWEFVVDEDWTYVNVTIPDRRSGTEKWVEVCRCPTPALYLEPMYLLVDYALRANDGLPKSEREDFVIDWIEVLQKTEQINAIPKPFVARPQLVGDAAVGGTLTCIPNVENVTDLRYYWFADGYPLTYGADPTYTLTEAEVGKTIRCMVKAVGALDMPEAWTEPVLVK